MARLPCGALAQGGFGSARSWLIRPAVGVCHQAARVAKTAPSRRGGSWHHWWRHLWHHSLRYLCACVRHRQPQLALGNRAEATRRGHTQPWPAVTPQYTHAPLGAMVWGPPTSHTCGDCPLTLALGNGAEATRVGLTQCAVSRDTSIHPCTPRRDGVGAACKSYLRRLPVSPKPSDRHKG